MWPREACLGLRVQKFSPVFYRTSSPSDPLAKKERKWEEEVEEEDKEEERREKRRQKGGKGKQNEGKKGEEQEERESGAINHQLKPLLLLFPGRR